ncbi:MAG: glycosyltransferase [Spirochaetales bacterium]|nr:glycosyltransferase [Spirochaetales bacterium]
MSKQTADVSVLIALYQKDNPVYFQQAMESIYDQTVKPSEIVLVIDGPLEDNLEKIVTGYSHKNGNLKIIRLPHNQGLASALNEGLKQCRHDIIIRADSDDICLEDRIEHQYNFLRHNRETDVLGAWVKEYTEDMNKLISVRKVPELDRDIKKKMKRFNCINHPASAFRKSSVLKTGGYPLFRKSQDYALWSKMATDGFTFHNLQTVLVKMRCGEEMMKRRNIRYFYHEYRVLKFQRQIGFINRLDFMVNLFIRFIFRIVPNKLKSGLYRLIRIEGKL